MKAMVRHRSAIVIVLLLVLSVSVLIRCTGKDKKKTADSNTTSNDNIVFSGSAACAKCHADIYNSHIKTAHYLTSQPADEKAILGSFAEGSNVFAYNPLLNIKMNKTGDGFYQSIFYKGEKKMDIRFDIVTGSGAKGQTYLYWKDNKLFQMPISYFTAAHQWSNSPGFPPDRVMFDKPISTRCLECHATSVQLLSEPDVNNEEYDKNKMVYGINCEKCHGPGAQHISFQTEHPEEKTGKYIINQASLTRQKQLDMCRLCHDGSIKKTKPSFSFKAGESLADYFTTDTIKDLAVNTDNVDVHGNQFGLLKASKCFTQSQMTCNTCHNSHENERGNLALFSTRCATCHTTEHKPVAGMQATMFAKNCIDCHMPAKPSRTLTLFLNDQETPGVAYVRSHYISNYPDEVKKYLLKLKGSK